MIHRISVHVPKAVILLGCLITTLSCAIFEDSTIVLWTNQPEVASYVEVFNAEQEEYKVEITYTPSPVKALIEQSDHPDMIIGEGLTTREALQHLKPLTFLFEEQQLDKEMFYRELFNLGYYEQAPHLLPVSFGVQAVIFKPQNITRKLDNFFISFNDIKSLGGEFNEMDGSTFAKLGFSPEWNANFLYLTACALGTDFRETYTGELAWNDRKLQESIAFIRDWITSVNQSRELVAEFTHKYLYNPSYKLINNDRILFSYIRSIEDFLQIASEKRENLDFRLIAKDNTIRVRDDVLYFGVPKKTKNNTVVNTFITWFFDPATQEKLIELSEFKRIRTFGIADGFSSIVEVNERHFPRFYPFLSGHIPQERFLIFPSPLPPEWPDIKQQVLLPWLMDVVREETEETFSNRLKTWTMQKPFS